MSNVSHRLMCPNCVGKSGAIWDIQVLAGSLRFPLPSTFLQLVGPSPQAPSTSKLGCVFQVVWSQQKRRETKGAKGLCHCFQRTFSAQPRLALSVIASASLSLWWHHCPCDDGVTGLCHSLGGFLLILDSTSISFSVFQKSDQNPISFPTSQTFKVLSVHWELTVEVVWHRTSNEHTG